MIVCPGMLAKQKHILTTTVCVYIAHAPWRRCRSAQPRQLAGRPAAHRAQDLHAHALAQAQLLEVGVLAQEQRVEADVLLGPAAERQRKA